MRRRASLWLALTALLTLPACGFHPVYGSLSKDGNPVADELAAITIDPIPEHTGQTLRNDLIDRFNNKGRPTAPLYHLAIKLQVADEDLGTLANGTTTLAAVQASASYTLSDKDGKTLNSGSAASTGQYDKLISMYGTLAAHDGAVDRTIREVSEQVTARISLYFAERKPEQKPDLP